MTNARSSLGTSARSALLWSGGFTLARDVAQFATMLLLVRLLTPADYGAAALAQSVYGVAAVISFITFSSHTLQLRDPDQVDWQAHFTAAVVLNAAIAALVLSLAYGLSYTTKFAEVALPLAALAIGYLVDIPSQLRLRMLETNHDWKRSRLLLIAGAFLGLGTGLGVALMGGGLWALIVQPPLLGAPAAVDLFVNGRFKPDWTWSHSRYRPSIRFGLTRIGSGFLVRGRSLAEQGLLAKTFDLSTLGLFSRANGLAALIAGRIGTEATMSLYPVITRAQVGSAQFRRNAGLILRGVCWATAGAAGLVGLVATDMTLLLYGEQWVAVGTLLPFAAISVGLAGASGAANSLILASDEPRVCFLLDLCAAITGVAFALALIPYGLQIYFFGLVALGALMLGLSMAVLVRKNAIDLSGVAAAVVPALVAAGAALTVVFASRRIFGTSDYIAVRLAVDTSLFSLTFLTIFRIAFARQLVELVAVLPGRSRIATLLGLSRTLTDAQ